MTISQTFYGQAGVNISAGDAFGAFTGALCRQSYVNSPYVQVTDFSKGNFRGPRGWKPKGLPEDCVLTDTVDGIGTKVVLIDAAQTYGLAAHDIVAMTAMDITRYGGLPLVFKNILDVKRLGDVDSETYRRCQEIMRGLSRLANEHSYVLLTGETAELNVCVSSENPDASVKFNWGGCMTGVYHPDKMILGDTLAPGQVVIVFADTFRSNGISAVRKALAMKYGPTWWNNPLAQDDISHCAAPSVQYDRYLNRLHGWFNNCSLQPLAKLHLVAHLSGGAFKGKFGDLLKPLGLSAELNDLFDPPQIMRDCAQWSGMSGADCYETWNGGQGALVVVDQSAVDTVLELAGRYHIQAKVSGKITEQRDHVVAITSKFDGKQVLYT